jgi:hypothetical protein
MQTVIVVLLIGSIFPVTSLLSCGPVEEVTDKNTITVQKYVGRTSRVGNLMWQVDTLIQLSYLAGCSIKFPSNYSEHFTSSCPLLVNDNPIPENEKFCTQVVKHTSNVVTKGYHQRHNAQDGKAAQRQHQHDFMHDAKMKYFETNDTHAFGHACGEDMYSAVGIHVRGGDTVKGAYSNTTGYFEPAGVHHGYAPNPTAYFIKSMAVIQASLPKIQNLTFNVFCEDLNSPTCAYFQKQAAYSPELRMNVGNCLIVDLVKLACSRSAVVQSFGTFNLAYTFYHQKGQVWHKYSPGIPKVNAIAGNCSENHKAYRAKEVLYYIEDEHERDRHNVLTKNWTNNEFQRSIIDYHFNISYVVDKGCE